MIATRGKEARIVEVKYDAVMARTGNMFIEIKKDKIKNEDGWMYYTASNYLMYGDAINDIFYIFRTEDMLEYLRKYKHEYMIREKLDTYKITVGALVSPYDFE